MTLSERLWAGCGDSEEFALPAETRALILSSSKIGHEVNCLGLAKALGLHPRTFSVRPRALFAALAPYGPADPRDGPDRPASPLAPPFPDILFASGRVTVPYFRALKRAAGPRTFAVFLQDPRWSRSVADLIWAPEHDRVRGENVFVTPTSPHPLRPAALAQARAHLDPRIARLKAPRLAMILGGPSAAYQFTPQDNAALADIARLAMRQGFSVMATPSRRTPPELLEAMRAAAKAPESFFLWEGDGENPYLSMVANADSILVTGDSVNMVGETLATHSPVQLYEPTGGDPKIRGFVDRLVALGALRRWNGRFETWAREPIDATADIAREVRQRFQRFRAEG